MALIDPELAEEIGAKVSAAYLKAYPGLAGKYGYHLCASADGAAL